MSLTNLETLSMQPQPLPRCILNIADLTPSSICSCCSFGTLSTQTLKEGLHLLLHLVLTAQLVPLLRSLTQILNTRNPQAQPISLEIVASAFH